MMKFSTSELRQRSTVGYGKHSRRSRHDPYLRDSDRVVLDSLTDMANYKVTPNVTPSRHPHAQKRLVPKWCGYFSIHFSFPGRCHKAVKNSLLRLQERGYLKFETSWNGTWFQLLDLPWENDAVMLGHPAPLLNRSSYFQTHSSYKPRSIAGLSSQKVVKSLKTPDYETTKRYLEGFEMTQEQFLKAKIAKDMAYKELHRGIL